MPICPSCGFDNPNPEMRCPECGSFYSKAIELIEQEAAAEAAQTFRGQCQRILASGNIKQALLAEWQGQMDAMTPKAWFTLAVIFAFVFMMTLAVL